MNTTLRTLLSLLLPFSISGCGLLPLETDPVRSARPLDFNAQNLPPESGPLKRVVIFNFENNSAFQDHDAVEMTRQAFVQTLHESQRVVLVSPSEITSSKKEEQMAEARKKGINVLVYGAVHDVRTQQTGDPVGLVRKIQLTTEATVEVTAIATTSGQELFKDRRTARISHEDLRVAERSQQQRYVSHDPSLTHHALRQGFGEMIEGLLRSLQKIQWRGRIAMIQGERVFINAGRLSGLKPGDILRVSEVGKEVYDPESGELLGQSPGRVKGTLEVISYFGQDGSITLLHSGSGFYENDIVELY